MIVADTSWISALRDPHDAHHSAAVRVNDEIGDEVVVLAAVTLAECLVVPAAMGVLDEAELALRSAYEIDDVDADAPRRWATTRASRSLRLPDAIVLATALNRDARGVATFDVRLGDAVRAEGLVVLA